MRPDLSTCVKHHNNKSTTNTWLTRTHVMKPMCTKPRTTPALAAETEDWRDLHCNISHIFWLVEKGREKCGHYDTASEELQKPLPARHNRTSWALDLSTRHLSRTGGEKGRRVWHWSGSFSRGEKTPWDTNFILVCFRSTFDFEFLYFNLFSSTSMCLLQASDVLPLAVTTNFITTTIAHGLDEEA